LVFIKLPRHLRVFSGR